MNDEQKVKQLSGVFYFTQGIAIGTFIGLIAMCAILRWANLTPRQVSDRWRSDAEKHGAGLSIVDTNGEYLRFEWNDEKR